jgi:hypothetical protein
MLQSDYEVIYQSPGTSMIRIGIFIFLFAVVFAFATVGNGSGTLAFGSHSFTSYGWPHPWLHVHSVTKTTEFKIDWLPFVLSSSAAGAIAGMLSLPVFFWLCKKSETNCDRVP